STLVSFELRARARQRECPCVVVQDRETGTAKDHETIASGVESARHVEARGRERPRGRERDPRVPCTGLERPRVVARRAIGHLAAEYDQSVAGGVERGRVEL